MHLALKTLLNRVEPMKGFVYESSRIRPASKARRGGLSAMPTIEIGLRAHHSQPGHCSQCQQPAPGYDTLPERRFQFVPLWGMTTWFLYAPRRLECDKCGIHVEYLPWALGKRPVTQSFAWFLASWAKLLSWQVVARRFQTSWESVFRSVEMAVIWGRERLDLTGISALGVDEIYWKKGKFLTLVYQINEGMKRLLFVVEDRREASLCQFFAWFGKERSALITFVCSDMGKPYLNVIARHAPNALNILDRYHIAAKMNKAIDEVRAQETRALKSLAHGAKVVLTHSRWCLLKRPENLTENQAIKLKDLLSYNLKSIRAYLLKEEFQMFWEYVSPAWAEKFMDQWCKKVMRSRLEPMKKIARMIRVHKPLILNWFAARDEVSLGAVEGLNNKLKASIRTSYGFRTPKAIKIMLYHKLGALPEPELTHRFC
ncbi:MAG: ISL3 family transposase [Acidiferrobacter thiooxydans]